MDLSCDPPLSCCRTPAMKPAAATPSVLLSGRLTVPVVNSVMTSTPYVLVLLFALCGQTCWAVGDFVDSGHLVWTPIGQSSSRSEYNYQHHFLIYRVYIELSATPSRCPLENLSYLNYLLSLSSCVHQPRSRRPCIYLF